MEGRWLRFGALAGVLALVALFALASGRSFAGTNDVGPHAAASRAQLSDRPAPQPSHSLTLISALAGGHTTRTRAAGDTPSGWSGTITYYARTNESLADGTLTSDLEATITVKDGSSTIRATYTSTDKRGNGDVYQTDGSGQGDVVVTFGTDRVTGYGMRFLGFSFSATTVATTASGVFTSTVPVDIGTTDLFGQWQPGIMSLQGDSPENFPDTGFTSDWHWNLARTKKLAITNLKLYDLGPKQAELKYLSASDHNYFPHKFPDVPGGSTLVYGAIALEGFAGPPLPKGIPSSPQTYNSDKVLKVELQILEGGAKRAVGALPDIPAAILDTYFGPEGKLAIEGPRLLFVIPADQFAAIDQSKGGKLTLRVHVETQWGDVADKNFTVEKLVRYTGENRYGGRDRELGGDDWARPSVVKAVTYFSHRFSALSWGDFSKMDAGYFPPHKSHRDGLDVDGSFPDYFQQLHGNLLYRCVKRASNGGCTRFERIDKIVTAHAAVRLLALLDDRRYGHRIEKVFVDFWDGSQLSPFSRAIDGVRLRDGRLATDVIRPDAEHDGHFHLRFLP